MRGRCGAKRTKRAQQAALKARQILTLAPKTPLKQLGQQLGCSYSTAQRMARTDLKLHPYKIANHQKLRSCDEEARKRYCAWFLRKSHTSAEFIQNIWFSDEAHFHLNGRVNSQNYRFWGTEPSKEVAERSLHSKKCIAWCAISAQAFPAPSGWKTATGRRRQSTPRGTAKFWEDFGVACTRVTASCRTGCRSSGFIRMVRRPTVQQRPGLGFGSTSRTVWLPRGWASSGPLTRRIWPHRTSFCGVTWSRKSTNADPRRSLTSRGPWKSGAIWKSEDFLCRISQDVGQR